MRIIPILEQLYSDKIQISRFQAAAIGQAISAFSPGCRMLVFGLGHDTDLWLGLNQEGCTWFLETSEEWITTMSSSRPRLKVLRMPTYGLTVQASLVLDPARLADYSPLPELAQATWDVILVDAPAGYRPSDPGRAVSIAWAASLSSPWTHVFVDDYERELEHRLANILLRYRRNTASFVLSAADDCQYRQMLWSAGDPITRKPGPQFIVQTIATMDYAQRWRFCLDSQRTYCRKMGYRHRVVNPEGTALHPKWAKLNYALQEISNVRGLLVLDADAEIDPATPPLETLLEEYPGKDVFYVRGISGRPNSGVLLLRGGHGNVAPAFLRHCLSRRLTPVASENFVTAEGENGHVIEALEAPEFSLHSQELGKEWNSSDPSHEGPIFIRHYTNLRRREALNRQ